MESILSEHDGGSDAPMDFDSLFDTKALRIMRVLIPFLPAPYQPFLAVWVRFSQLRYALSLLHDNQFRTGMAHKTGSAESNAPTEQSLSRLLLALKPCLSESEYQELCRIQNMFSMYRRFQLLAPYLSALGGMSGDLSAADMMGAFSAMQGENGSVNDIMSAFSAMQGGENRSANDIMNAFSSMQNTAENSDAAIGSPDSDQLSQESADAQQNTADSSGPQSTGSGMDLNRILDLLSLFQASPNGTDAEPNQPERQDGQNHE